MTGWRESCQRDPRKGAKQRYCQALSWAGRGGEGGCRGGAGALLFSAAFLMPASSSGASGLSPIRSNLEKQRHWQLLGDLGWPQAAPSSSYSPSPNSPGGHHHLHVECHRDPRPGEGQQEGPSCSGGMRKPQQRAQVGAGQPLGNPPSRQGLCLRCCQATCHVGLEAVAGASAVAMEKHSPALGVTGFQLSR